MFRNYIKLTLRRLGQNKLFSGLNILGLALGLAVFILILQYVAFEWSYNRMYSDADRIFRVFFTEDGETPNDYHPPAFGPEAKAAFPSITALTRYTPFLGNGVFSPEDSFSGQQGTIAFREEGTIFVDSDFLKVFDRPLLTGTGDLSAPKTLLLSQSMAEKYFGETEVAGRELRLNNQFGNTLYTVKGVFEDFPRNSDIQGDILLSIQTLVSPENRNGNDWADPAGWNNSFLNTYIKLDDPSYATSMEDRLTAMVAQYLPGEEISIDLQPLAQIHLGNRLNDPFLPFGSRALVLFLLVVALLILLIAWINYINLSTAQALNRAKEFSVRKVVGAGRGQLVRQHLVETFIVAAFSLGLGLILVEALQGPFNRMADLDLSMAVLDHPLFWAAGLLLIALTTLAAGAYVAFVLTEGRPVETLRGTFSRSAKGIWVRRTLVLGQFSISIAFIAGTLILYQQLDFLRNRDLGMQLNNRIAIVGPSVGGEENSQRVQTFFNQVEQLPYVRQMTASGGIPGTGYNFTANGITRAEPEPGEEDLGYKMLMIDDEYLDTYEIDLLAGRSFQNRTVEAGWSNSDQVILNDQAARSLGFESAEAAVGQRIFWGEDSREVIGVIRDYNHQSLHTPIQPIVFLPAVNSNYFTLVLEEDSQDRLKEIQEIYQSTFPGNPYNFFFVNEEFDRYYQSEQRMGQVFTGASLLAVFISCLGLFGLAVFTAEQRTKEIGIRKVLGASMRHIVVLLSNDFLKPVLMAMLIATPVAWYFMDRWLENFAYQVHISWWIFALAGVFTLAIAFFTVSIQSIRVASANPVDSLRDE